MTKSHEKTCALRGWTLLAITAALFVPAARACDLAGPSPAIIEWDANTESDLAGYYVHYGVSSRGAQTDPRVFRYDLKVNAGNVLQYSVGNLSAGITYYFSITAYDRSGNESLYSNEGCKAILAPSPTPTATPTPVATPSVAPTVLPTPYVTLTPMPTSAVSDPIPGAAAEASSQQVSSGCGAARGVPFGILCFLLFLGRFVRTRRGVEWNP